MSRALRCGTRAVVCRLLFLLPLVGAAEAGAQQPFASDDAEVTGQWHFEYFNEYAILSRSASPDLRQDTNNFVVQYGLLQRLEVDLDFPFIAIDRARGSALGSAFGLGDVDFAAKYRLTDESPDGFLPAFAAEIAVEVPTGDKSNQLGSGYTDLVFNSVAQKTFGENTHVHLNFGYQLSGNTLTGAIGIRTPGHILTGGLSVSREVSGSLLLGIDVNGAQIRAARTLDRQLQLTAGGSYSIRKNATLDFAVVSGRYDSPRLGIVLGVSFSPTRLRSE